ncbi:hypothetical protein FXO37_29920 [Capsicum annuum]|nr:hypothetical protein FXO37_29920 [Capsicum annuum]
MYLYGKIFELTLFSKKIKPQKLVTIDKPIPNTAWKPPAKGFKLNIDESFDSNSNEGGAGGLIRNVYGDWVWGFHAKFTALSLLHAKTVALYLSINIAKKLKCYNILKATDSKTLASIFSEGADTNNNLSIMCRDLLQELGITSICHENRRFNRAVDVLAKEGRKRQVPQFLKKWIVPPLFVRKIIAADKEGTSFPNMDIDSNNNMMETRKTAFVRQHEVPVASNVDIACKKLKKMSELSEGYNIIGICQRDMVSRGVIEFCDGGPLVRSLVSLAGPHAGIASVPFCGGMAPAAVADGQKKMQELMRDAVKQMVLIDSSVIRVEFKEVLIWWLPFVVFDNGGQIAKTGFWEELPFSVYSLSNGALGMDEGLIGEVLKHAWRS